jgi:hypothetical protein
MIERPLAAVIGGLITSTLHVANSRVGIWTHRPANVPQRHANQAMHARYATHERTFFLSQFVSVENKGSNIQLPKRKVASSSLVARSRFSVILKSNIQMFEEF